MSIAILKGGKYKVSESERTANNIMQDFRIGGKKYFDVQIDKDGNWFSSGMPTNAHSIFAKSDHVIDTTHRDSSVRHRDDKLAHDMGINTGHNKLLNKEDSVADMRRILKQIKVKTPRFVIIKRSRKTEVSNKALANYFTEDNITEKIHASWRSLHMPLIIKSAKRRSYSIETYSVEEALDHVKSIHRAGDDAILDEKVKGRNYSVFVIRNFRGQKIYVSTIFEKLEVGRTDYRRAQSLNDKEKEELNKVVTHVHSHIEPRFARYDLVKNKSGFTVVHISTQISYDDNSFLKKAFEASGITFAEVIG
jgi:hypothetical protein